MQVIKFDIVKKVCPVTEMITCDQDTISICSELTKFKYYVN